MALMPGTRLGPYEITASLGEGGMGEVYRARDTKLGRTVAIKILPDLFASDPNRVARFEREARSLAALNHPNAATLYGFETCDGRHLLVMELVEGETLADLMARGPIPIETVLAIARQIAEGLEAAHERGIVHRDLKPANVKVTPDDHVKLLDFGLAKAMEPDAGAAGGVNIDLANSPTFTRAHDRSNTPGIGTAVGVIMGTAAYMSPEQARGFPADHRSDIFSFGVVLFEMVTGRRLFDGETLSDILAGVIARDADLTTLDPSLNPRLPDLIRRCLAKSPKKRWQAIGDVRAELEIIAAAPRMLPSTTAAAAIASPLWKRALPALALAAIASAVTGAIVWRSRPAPAAGAVTRFAVALPAGQQFGGAQRTVVAISPDGRTLAYSAGPPRGLWVRPLDTLEAHVLKESQSDSWPIGAVFSPDGQSLAYWTPADETIKRIGLDGGAAITLCQTELPSGMTWSTQGLIFSNTEGIHRVAEGGGEPELLLRTQPGEITFEPQFLPGGRTLLFTVADGVGGSERWDAGRIVAQTIGRNDRRTILDGVTDARYIANGHLLFARSGVVYAVPFDAATLKVTGPEAPVINGVSRGSGTFGSGTVNLTVSANGTLAYLPGSVTPVAATVAMETFDFTGAAHPVGLTPGAYQTPRVSPDGRRLAFVVDDGRDVNVWVFDVGSDRAPRRLTFGGHNRSIAWSSDSQWVAYRSDRDGPMSIYRQREDGTGAVERLTTPDKGSMDIPLSSSPDGQSLLFERVAEGRTTVWVLSLHDRHATRFSGIDSSQLTGAVFSPDGRWVAYAARETGRQNRVYVEPFPATGAKYQVSNSTEDAHHPVWSRDGTFLFYTPGPGNRILRVPVTFTPSISFGVASNLERPFSNVAGSSDRPYDMWRDGTHFVSTSDPVQSDTAPRSLTVVTNWFAELKQGSSR